jgi:hypothetical protein
MYIIASSAVWRVGAGRVCVVAMLRAWSAAVPCLHGRGKKAVDILCLITMRDGYILFLLLLFFIQHVLLQLQGKSGANIWAWCVNSGNSRNVKPLHSHLRENTKWERSPRSSQ